MNFSSVRNIYVDLSLRVLGYYEPSDNCVATLAPRDKLPTVSNWHVSQWLRALPSLEDLHNLQASQMKIRTRTLVDKKLRRYCYCAGNLQIEALSILVALASTLASLAHEHLAQPFACYEDLKRAAIAIRRAHGTWEASIDEEAFFKKENQRSRTVRFQYLSYLLRIVHIISALTFPVDYQDPYVDILDELLTRNDWQKQLIFDSEATYELSKQRARRARPGVIAPPHRFPAGFKLHGQTVLRPYLVYQDGGYGQQLVPNARCIRGRRRA